MAENSTIEHKSERISCPASIKLSLSCSSRTVSLSADDVDEPFNLIVSALTITSTNPSTPITIRCLRYALDNTRGQFYGLTGFACTTNPHKRLIKRSDSTRANIHDDFSANLRDTDYLTFRTILPPGKGSIQVKHQMSRERLKTVAKSGEDYYVKLCVPYYAQLSWWAFGDLDGDLKDKNFWDGETFFELDEGWVVCKRGEDVDEGVDVVLSESEPEVVFKVVD